MQQLKDKAVLVTPRTFGVHDPALRVELEASVGKVHYNDKGRQLDPAELREKVMHIDGIVAGLDEFDASVIAAAPRLQIIARYGVGVDNVDLTAAQRHHVVVTNTPGANSNAVAELSIGLMFSLARSIYRPSTGRTLGNTGVELKDRCVGIIGLGKVGSLVAQKATALGCTVLAHDPHINKNRTATGVHSAPLERVLAKAHFLSLHCSLTPETKGLINRNLINQMPVGAFLINTARGELIDEKHLIEALDSGHLAGAALDALGEEPPRPDHPLMHRDDVLVTPHIGARTAEATAAMGRHALDNLLAVLSGRPPLSPVEGPR